MPVLLPELPRMQTACRPHADPMQTPCRTHADLMQIPCRPHSEPMQIPCRSHADPMQNPCRPHANPIPPIILSSTAFPIPPYFPTLSHIWYYLRKQILGHTTLCETCLILRGIQQDTIKINIDLQVKYLKFLSDCS